MLFSPFPVLTTARLRLDQIELADDKEIFTLRSDTYNRRYIDGALAKNIEDAREFINKIKKRWTKWQKKRSEKLANNGVLDESNFRIGLILLLGGIAGAVVGSIIDFGLLNWLGGLMALVGLGFIIWSLIEYSS